MKHLIIYAHPNPNSFCHAILQSVENVSKSKGHEVKIKDLYAINFNPTLQPSDFEAFGRGEVPSDIKCEQEEVTWADLITFIYPIWWASMPAILKGYIDRVFANGFAYKYDNNAPVGLLEGKKALVFNTTGSPSDAYAENGMHDAMKQMVNDGIFKFCGIEPLYHTFFGAVPFVDDESRKEYLTKTETLIQNL
ncbi:NAD(P)H-dependent oxidoreductase [Clostridium sp. UBA6640]|uniref:NAD(P)H-dependent oxidoreductase n=1 Tax=Clostridium sp. UBA6640 TaxID=1946370 RepID=UPI0025B9D3A8|nr:NAD(P)H-dependent oxidoreductase [Clostridium sp. UBA6640]